MSTTAEHLPLRARRLELGMTLPEASRRTGIDVAGLSRMERGLVGLRAAALVRYADVLGLDDIVRTLGPHVGYKPPAERSAA